MPPIATIFFNDVFPLSLIGLTCSHKTGNSVSIDHTLSSFWSSLMSQQYKEPDGGITVGGNMFQVVAVRTALISAGLVAGGQDALLQYKRCHKLNGRSSLRTKQFY